jgi:hypothetical protein
MERLAAEGELRAYRHEGFWQPMDTLRDVRYLESLWARATPRGERARARIDGVCVTEPPTTAAGRPHFWRDRPTLVTVPRAARRLAVRALVTPVPTWCAWCATGCRRARSGGAAAAPRLLARERGDGRVRDQGVARVAPSARTRWTAVFHLAAQTVVGHRQPQPGLDFREQRAGHLGAARGVPALAAREGGRVRVVDKAYGAHDTLPYDEGARCRAVTRTT